jgi:hypothetical protein
MKDTVQLSFILIHSFIHSIIHSIIQSFNHSTISYHISYSSLCVICILYLSHLCTCAVTSSMPKNKTKNGDKAKAISNSAEAKQLSSQITELKQTWADEARQIVMQKLPVNLLQLQQRVAVCVSIYMCVCVCVRACVRRDCL